MNIAEEPDAQCDFCRDCKKNYSIATGSSRCIPCPNDDSLALLVFFAAAGVVLVLIILSLNLTLTQGLINGLIFYANITQSIRAFSTLKKKNANLTFFFAVKTIETEMTLINSF